MSQKWHTISKDDILSSLNTSINGLTHSDVETRLEEYGENELQTKKSTPYYVIFARQFLNPLVYILLAAGIVKFAVGGFFDGVVIVGVIMFMAIIGFIQEARAEKAMEALKQLAAPKAKIKRDGVIEMISSSKIVPGDLLMVDSGDKLPADARLIESSNISVNESILTGESVPVEKNTGIADAEASISDRKNMLYMGTSISYGRGAAVVTATGMSTEMGKIATAIKEVKPEKTPLQKSINTLGKYMIGITISIVGLLILIGIHKGMDWIEMFMLSVAAVVAAIPEGLPAVVTVVLAVGMRMMARRNAIIRKLVAVETLGSTTVICSDKTGTLTLNEMTVQQLWSNGSIIEVKGDACGTNGEFFADGKNKDVDNDADLKLLLQIGALCSNASIKVENGKCVVIGDPTEGAFAAAAMKAKINRQDMEKSMPRLGEIPFQSEKQYMATVHKQDNQAVLYAKGSPEKILSMCSHIQKDGKPVKLDDGSKKRVLDVVDGMAKNAMRVLGAAYCNFEGDSQNPKEQDTAGRLVFTGLVGMIDPPRQEAKESVKLCKSAGIRVMMITGDNKITAGAIAKEIGIDSDEVLTGAEVQNMSDEELSGKVKNVSVFARIEPLHKLKIVRAVKNLGNIVAMTGDGVNDAPALEASDIGIAMGITGTDVAKEASDMVLADDNFASIVAAVEEGRVIFNRLRNAVLFLLTTCFGELFALMLSVFFTGEAPLLPVQILWINLVTGALVAIPLGLEPKVGDELSYPPRDPKVGLIYPGMLMRIFFLSTVLSIGAFLVFRYSLSMYGLKEARTMIFCSIVVFEWLVAFNCRSDAINVFKIGIFKNMHLIKAVVLAVFLQLVIIYVGFIQPLFDATPLSAYQWMLVILPGIVIFGLENLRVILLPKLFSAGKWKPVRWLNKAKSK